MQYGICQLSVVSVRATADDTSEMVTQLLYGEHFKILEHRKFWFKIRIAFDNCEGWVRNQQVTKIDEASYSSIEKTKKSRFSADLISYVETNSSVLIPIVLGSTVQNVGELSHRFEGSFSEGIRNKANLVQTALHYLNAPFLKGGKTPLGIDASAFTQMVYKINGYKLLRKASEQASQGEALSFIEESESGDLAFFDNSDGEIYHVGIMMENNYIVHVDEKVRIDRLDHTGIFNTELGSYTYNLRVIKKII